MNTYNQLLELITDDIEIDGKYYNLKEEMTKFYTKKNKAAGIRIRKIMQLIRKKAKDIRDNIQEDIIIPPLSELDKRVIQFVEHIDKNKGLATMEDIFVHLITLYNDISDYKHKEKISSYPTHKQIKVMWDRINIYNNNIKQNNTNQI